MLPAICHSHSTGSRRRSARYRCARTHVLYELRVGQHEEVVEDIVKAAVGDFRLADQPVHLLLDLVGPGDGLLGELLQEAQELRGTGSGAQGGARGGSAHRGRSRSRDRAPRRPLTPASEAKDQLWLPLRISSSDQGRSHTGAGSAASCAPFICERRAVKRASDRAGPDPTPPARALTLTAGRPAPRSRQSAERRHVTRRTALRGTARPEAAAPPGPAQRRAALPAGGAPAPRAGGGLRAAPPRTPVKHPHSAVLRMFFTASELTRRNTTVTSRSPCWELTSSCKQSVSSSPPYCHVELLYLLL